MRKESERKRKSDRVSGGNDGDRRPNSRLRSWFSSFVNKNLEPSTKDDVMKPLYYIAGDFNSEKMEDTVESVDDESIDEKEEVEIILRKPRKPQPRRVDFLFSRFGRGMVCQRKEIQDDEIYSVRLASSSRTKETDANERSTNQGLDTKEKMEVKKTSACREKKFSHVRNQACRMMRLPFLWLSKCTQKRNSRTFSTKIAQDDRNPQIEMNEDKSDDMSLLPTTPLGVTFAHPVYTGKCHLDEARPDTTNYLWTNMQKGLSVESEDCNLPPTISNAETAKAECSGNGGSSLLYPTDEQSNDDGNIYYGSFDSDADIPFDEIFTDTSFFEFDQI